MNSKSANTKSNNNKNKTALDDSTDLNKTGTGNAFYECKN